MSSANRYDAIVIGGGHNGLTSAAYLARAGQRVLVLERRHVLGGAAVSEELHPGFTFSVASYVVSLLRPEIIRELRLPEHGLQLMPLECSFTPLPNGDSLARWADPDQTRREIARFSAHDAEAYPEFGRTMVRMCRFVKPLLAMTPPDPASFDPRDLLKLASVGRRFRDLGPEDLYTKIKMLSMSSADFLDEWFEADPLKASMAVSGIIGTYQGVRSASTAYVLLHHYMGEIDGSFRAWGFSKGGTGGVSLAIASAARSLGAEIRTEAPVARILTAGGRATGVALESGEEIEAGAVLSSADPHQTFERMMEPAELDPEFIASLRRFRYRGSSGKVNLALDRAPDFACRPGIGPHLMGDIAIAPSLDYLETAWQDAKYGDFSKRPYINVVIPSLTDPSVAPPGKHVMSCFVQYAPYELRDGTWDERREEFGDTVVDTIAEYVPGFKDSILYRQVLTPLDLERMIGLTEGNIFQGELSLDQLFFQRPAPQWARFRTPVGGLYLGGSATHPGGGIMGAPGRLAAFAVLEDRAGGGRSGG